MRGADARPPSDAGMPPQAVTPPGPQPPAPVPFRDALRFWIRLGFISFGGPAGQIAILHREVVDRRRWIPEDQFLRALNFCMMLPGPEAQQLITYVGWRLHGVAGGLAAGIFFILPSVFILLALSFVAAAYGRVPAVAGILYGIQPVVLAVVAEAVVRIARRALVPRGLVLFAAAAFVALNRFGVPFPAVVAAAALIGAMLPLRGEPPPAAPRHGYPPLARAVRIALVFAFHWAVPVGALVLLRGGADVTVREALFFTKAAFVTFGGAYAVLSYVAEVAVHHYGWLTAPQMIQGLALAESTPGPLIMVLQYVGFLGAWNAAAGLPPWLAGTIGGLVTTYMTFLPSFIFIFVGAPYIEAMAGSRRLQAAFRGVTAAVVGVVLNLAVYFGGRVLFPGAGGLDLFTLAVAVASALVLWKTPVPIAILVPAGGIAGMIKTFLF